MTRRIARRDVGLPAGLADASLHPVLARIYAGRGIRAARDLDLSLEALLPVGSLEGVEAAAELLAAHRDAGIVVVGDFDADGATSTALMLRALRAWGFAAVSFLVPDRFRLGYGLTPEIVELAAERSPALLVTVDNGISSVAGVQRARELGIRVLVTDHHLPGAELPQTDATVNPNLPGSHFGSRALAGVGVAFYVLAALQRRLRASGLGADKPSVAEFLDLVALGTVADLVPLDANNRILVSQGLRRIRGGRCVPGIRALLAIAERPAGTLTATDLGFAVAPRLNAAGRLTDMSIGIRCLLADDEAEAMALATELDALNRERRRIEADMQELALAAVRQLERDPAADDVHRGLCIFDAGWHQGVVGLVASRIKDRMRRPVIAFARGGDPGQLRGSARSVPGVHIRDVLDAIASREPGLVDKFGGHAMAAGLSLREENLERFARAFDTEVARWPGEGNSDAILTDGALAESDIALSVAQLLRDAGPWGQAFPEPSFDGVFEITGARSVGERHVKLWVRPEGSQARFDAIAFNWQDLAEPRPLPAGRAQLVYRLDINAWRGERRLQLMVDHLEPLAAGT
jgi:single-stranded-DNA-specific exonuclease